MLAAIALVPSRVAGQELVKYAIAPGSAYTYKPSPWLPIPGGQPYPWRLDFGVSGILVVQYDSYFLDLNRILSADIALSGNEAIQNNPPNPYMSVTATRVAQFLEAVSFTDAFLAPQYTEYNSEQSPGLRLRKFLNGNLTLTGGYDATFIDGDAMLFNLSATPLMPGDYNGDGLVDDQDFNVWKESFGTENLVADGNGDFVVDSADYVVWRKHASTGAGSATNVPEPAAAALLFVASILSRWSRIPRAAKPGTTLCIR
jgi:hypothetical protein